MKTIDIHAILHKENLVQEDIINLLNTSGKDKIRLFEQANRVKQEAVGNKVFFRGLIELSNICAKNCYYCGIRKDNQNFVRYNLSDDEVLGAAQFAYENNFASLAIQSGELTSKSFTSRITRLLQKIHQQTNCSLHITLSLGEQPGNIYKEWLEAGAHRYLLRIETANPVLYRKIHPDNSLHNMQNRIECLYKLKEVGYQVGSGVMIGLPFQTTADLANDLLFLLNFGIDMVGMGPYIEHADTPLYTQKDSLLSLEERFQMSLKMIAILRILMPKINIASATALQAIDKLGREKALKVGANVIMPNITPGKHRDDYQLYQNKPCTDDSAEDCKNCLETRVALAGNTIGYGEWGDSKAFLNRVNEKNN